MPTDLHTPMNLQTFEFNEQFPRELKLDDMMQITFAVLTARENGGQQPLKSENGGMLDVVVYGPNADGSGGFLGFPVVEDGPDSYLATYDTSVDIELWNVNQELDRIYNILDDVHDDANNALRVDQIA